jgi:hypothetical protein
LWIGVGFSGLEPGQAGRAVIVEARFQNGFVSDQLLGGEAFRAESGFNVGSEFRNRRRRAGEPRPSLAQCYGGCCGAQGQGEEKRRAGAALLLRASYSGSSW